MAKQRSKWAKRCKECGKVIVWWNKSGLCSRHYLVNWKKKNKEKIKGYCEKRKAKKKEYDKEYYQRNKERINKRHKEDGRDYYNRKKS